MRIAALAGVLLLAACGGAEIVPPPVPLRAASEDPFDETVLHYVDLTVAEADLPALVPFSDEYVRCDLVFDETPLASVGVRIKGHSTARPVGDKPSWTLKTNALVSGQKLHGKKKIHLHNCISDASFLSEHMAYEIWRRSGHPARRTAFARVTLNGAYLGVYVVAEPYDDGFLKEHFADGGGNLYEGVIGVDVTDPANLELDTNEDENDRTDMEALARTLTEEPDESLDAALETSLDVEAFLTYWAVEDLVGHWDGYACQSAPFTPDGDSPNNWYAYDDPSTGLFTWLPHGADQCFGDLSAPVLDEPTPLSSLAYRLFRHPRLRPRFEQRMLDVLDAAWVPVALLARIDAAMLLIHGSVAEGDASATFVPRAFLADVDRLREFILFRPALVRTELGR